MSEVKAKILKQLDELKEQAVISGDVNSVVEASKLSALVETEGAKIVEKPAYRIHMDKCLLEGPRPKTQEEAREKMKQCAKQYEEMTEEEKQKLGKELEAREV